MSKISWNNILCIVITGLACGCEKEPLSYTSKMAGMHSWTGVEYAHVNSRPIDTIINVAYDIPIIVINDKKIVFKQNNFWTDTMTYSSSNKKANTIQFTSYSNTTGFTYYYDTLTFNYSTNRLTHSESYDGAHAYYYRLIHTIP